jgi:tetratricopeptide (TPR) repeat protein
MVPGTAPAPSGEFDIAMESAPRSALDQDLERNSEAMRSYLVGELAYDREDFETALDNLSRASALTDQAVPRLHAKLAELFVRTKDLKSALEESDKALQANPDDPDNLLLKAGILEAMDRDEQAIPLYERVIAQHPSRPDPYLLLSNLYVHGKQEEKAITVLRGFSQKEPNLPEPWYYLGLAYEMTGNLAEAHKNLDHAKRIAPDNVSVGLDLVRIMLKEKNVDGARTLCSQIVEHNPDNVTARRVLGQLLIGENKLDEALEQLEVLQTVEEDPTDTRFKIALIQMERQNFPEAQRELNLVLAKNPKHAQARFYLATVYASSGQQQQALSELGKIPRDEKIYVKAKTFAAFIQRQQGDSAGAEAAVRDALKAEPDNESVFTYLIVILRDEHKYGDAEKLLRERLKAEPNDERLLFNYALVLHDLDREADARKAMESLLKVNPQNTDALNFLAYSLADSGEDYTRALELAKKAIELKPNDGYYLDTLGWVYYNTGKYPEAGEALGKAVSLVGDDAVILEHYGDTLAKLGNNVKALEQYRSALEHASDPKGEFNPEAAKRLQQKVDEMNARIPQPTRKAASAS